MVTFSIDTLPLSDNIIESNDYSSKVIYSAICDNLFKYSLSKNKIVKNACSHYSYTKNKKRLVIEIRDDLFFYNGDKVTSLDYYNSFRQILSSNTHIGIIFRNFFTDVKILDDRTLQFVNKIKNANSYKILSIYSATCLKGKYTSGPYYIADRKDNYILLKRNKFYRNELHNESANKLKFIITDGINDYKLFNNNKIQITNNTLCDIKKVDKYNYIKEENHIYLNLMFSLALMDKKFKKLRGNICSAIDRDKILQLLDYKYDANYSFIVGNLPNVSIQNRRNKIIKQLKNKRVLTLGYNNFYPNKEIALEIKKQLERVGFKIVLIENKFNIKNTSDLNIVLNHIEYISNDALVNGSYLSVILQKSPIYKRIFKLYNKSNNNYLLYLINKKLLKLNFKIPLIKMKGYYLKKDKYDCFNYIELNFEEL